MAIVGWPRSIVTDAPSAGGTGQVCREPRVGYKRDMRNLRLMAFRRLQR